MRDHGFGKHKPYKNLQRVFRALHICQGTAGFHNTNHKEQYQQSIANGLQGSVDAGYHIPEGAALEVGGGLRNELPDFA